MASKLRRAPLFGLDNPLGIAVLPKYSSPLSTFHKRNQTILPPPTAPPKPKGGIPTAPPKSTGGITATSTQLKNTSRSQGMEVGVASYPRQGSPVARGSPRQGSPVARGSPRQGSPVARGSPDRSARASPRQNLHVEFAQVGEMKEKKEKYLTAKYGAHQMSLIRKRLGVEMWMYDQLQLLYNQSSKEGKTEEKEVDIDELMDIEEDLNRRKYLQRQLSDCKQSSDKVDKFISELLERAKTL